MHQNQRKNKQEAKNWIVQYRKYYFRYIIYYRGTKTHKEETERKGVTLFLMQQRRVFFLYESFATVYCPTVHMFPTIKQLSVRRSYTNRTGINLCQQTRARRPDSLCGLVQSLCSILPLHTQPHISAVSNSVSAFHR